MVNSPPPSHVLAAFGAEGQVVLLAGGQGVTWRAGRFVLKPTDGAQETAWRAEVLDALPESEEFTVARPVRASDGTWTVTGWEAWHLVAGDTDPHRTQDIVRAGEAFHAAVASLGLGRPGFLDAKDDAWTRADRLSWDLGQEADAKGEFGMLAPLMAAREPLTTGDEQPVHGDLLGNVLFADGLPPAVIDWPVYWRPPMWASAVAVVDALLWYEGDPGLLGPWTGDPHRYQLLLRALIYRIATTRAVGRAPDPTYGPVAKLVLDSK
ncbi:TIGR02569 family protein [Streptomyces sp. TRM66268-LWL]|uniref:TIGR02569 family protein n=1 Tax=Streptomyces polyasparticus TaxID=2767826 RepID=A0ABR7SB06_9ACTN|nr:TIGR02569 family protein [Streptomyces polyasparticus]MBC9712623.1 TIGR02569 family protein [Streptomyces polyasparticus]